MRSRGSVARYAALAVLLTGLLGAPRARATPAWLAPVNISAAGESADFSDVAVDPQGDAVAVWSSRAGEANSVVAAVRPASSGVWQAPQTLSTEPGSVVFSQVAVDSQGDAVAVWGNGFLVRAAVRSSSLGAWGPAVTLGEHLPPIDEPAVAVDAQGDAVAAWPSSGEPGETVEAAVRPASTGVWQTPETVLTSEAKGEFEHPRVAMDAAGDAVVVASRRSSPGGGSTIQAAVRAPSTGAWGAPVTISEPTGAWWHPDVAMNPQGDAVAVWSAQPSGTYPASGIRAALRPASSGVWEAPVTISTSGSSPPDDEPSPSVAIDPQGQAVAVWETFGNEGSVGAAFMRESTVTSTWEAPVVLATSARYPRVAIDTAGNVVVVWELKSSVTQAEVRPDSSGTWQPPVNISEPGKSDRPAVALDSQGHGVAVWSRQNGSGSVIQASGFDAEGTLLSGVSVPARGTVGAPLQFSASPFDSLWVPATTTWTFGDGAAAGGTTVAHAYRAGGIYHVTVTAVDLLGNTARTNGLVAISGTARAVITRVHQARSVWREGRRLARIATRRPPVGTVFSFALNERARVRLTFIEHLAGVIRGHRCVARPSRSAARARCVRSVTAGALTFAGHAGTDRVSFQGRLSRSRRLAPGRYTVVIVASSPAGASAPAKLSFTIVA